MWSLSTELVIWLKGCFFQEAHPKQMKAQKSVLGVLRDCQSQRKSISIPNTQFPNVSPLPPHKLIYVKTAAEGFPTRLPCSHFTEERCAPPTHPELHCHVSVPGVRTAGGTQTKEQF